MRIMTQTYNPALRRFYRQAGGKPRQLFYQVPAMSVTAGQHHVVYRCNNAQETVDFYTNIVGMDYVMANFEVGPGSYLAFFELPNSPAMGMDPNTPEWI